MDPIGTLNPRGKKGKSDKMQNSGGKEKKTSEEKGRGENFDSASQTSQRNASLGAHAQRRCESLGKGSGNGLKEGRISFI